MSTWRERALVLINEAIDGVPRDEWEGAIKDAWQWGDKEGYPYQVWRKTAKAVLKGASDPQKELAYLARVVSECTGCAHIKRNRTCGAFLYPYYQWQDGKACYGRCNAREYERRMLAIEEYAKR